MRIPEAEGGGTAALMGREDDAEAMPMPKSLVEPREEGRDPAGAAETEIGSSGRSVVQNLIFPSCEPVIKSPPSLSNIMEEMALKWPLYTAIHAPESGHHALTLASLDAEKTMPRPPRAPGTTHKCVTPLTCPFNVLKQDPFSLDQALINPSSAPLYSTLPTDARQWTAPVCPVNVRTHDPLSICQHLMNLSLLPV